MVRPERFATRPAMAMRRVRTVHDGECLVGAGAAEDRGPADEVVRRPGAGQPGAIGGEVTGRHVLEPGAFFEVADREFDYGMVTVELVSVDCAALTVAGDERMVAPVRPQFGLRADQASAAHDQPHGPLLVGAAGRVHGLGDFGVAADGVVDRRPRRFVDRGDRPSNTGLFRDGDRQPTPRWSNVSTSSQDQKPLSARSVSARVAPERWTRAIRS